MVTMGGVMKAFLFRSTSILFMLITLTIGEGYAGSDGGPEKIKCKIRKIERHRTKPADRKILPHIRIFEGTSLNWSGYAAATNLLTPQANSVSAVSGSWIIPTVIASQSAHTYSSNWVGIDGYSDGTVEQIGTEQDWRNGGQHNYVWFEMYPQGAFEIVDFPINPGDHFSASVSYAGNSVFSLTITNHTRNATYDVPNKYTKSPNAKRKSAEWIVEAPFLDGVLPLADFGVASFTNCSATINGVTGPINSSHWQNDALTMTTQNNVPKAVPSSLTSNGTAFTITWQHE